MRTWFALCVVLSGALAALQLSAMDSSRLTFTVMSVFDEGFELAHFQITIDSDGSHRFDSKIPMFDRIKTEMRPREQVTIKQKYSRLPVLRKLSYNVATRSCEDSTVAVYKNGEFQFFAALAGIAALPLVIFGIAFAFLRLGPDRRLAIS